jgi:hypothetical protein
MSKKNNRYVLLAIIAGMLLIISGISGVTTWKTIQEFVTSFIIQNKIIEIIFNILVLFASLGGISVILGGLLIYKNKIRTGKFLISLGAGIGIIGLIVAIVIAIVKGNFVIGSFFSIGTIGLILSIVVRMKVKYK